MNTVSHTITEIDTGGSGLAWIEGAWCAFPGAVPGDRVEIGADGAPSRLVPREGTGGWRCPHGDCPGCPLQRMPTAEQWEAKGRLVRRVLESEFGTPLRVPMAPLAGGVEVLGYRSGAKLIPQRHGKGVALGIYRRGSHQVVDIPRCAVHKRAVTAVLHRVRRLLSQQPRWVGRQPADPSFLRAVAVSSAEASGDLLIQLVTRSAQEEGVLGSLAARLMEGEPRVSGVAWNLNPGSGNQIFGREWRVLRGQGYVREEFGAVACRASPGSFLQGNRERAVWAYRQLLRRIAPDAGELGVDLYCGVGALTLLLARRCANMIGIEANPGSAADAVANARTNDLGNVRIVQGTAEMEFPRLVDQGVVPGFVTLNPARKGMEPGVIEALRRARPLRIGYLSCNPLTLARDAALLCRGGAYQFTWVQPVDFFPQTAHVETVAVFER